MKYLLACLFACAVPRPLPSHYPEVEVVQQELPVTSTATITWKFCGEPWGNGYYLNHQIELCTEDVTISPAYARYVLLHELGHEAIETYHIKLDIGEEAAADEFAVVMAILEHREADIEVACKHFDYLAKHYAPVKGDDHPPDSARSTAMRCVIEGYQHPGSGCTALWYHALQTWHAALVAGGYDI